ncbi:hypothetical protein HA466_0096850 [Hirschfeldia incana]|nr:hypothetical protein HA466_0096850 [Hirschfeldia incana]
MEEEMKKGELEADTDELMHKKDRDSEDKKQKEKVCSIIHPQSLHLVAMKTNLDDQDQLLKDQRKRRSTSPADTNTSKSKE